MGQIVIDNLLSAKSITASGSETVVLDPPTWLDGAGNFGLQVTISGSGVIKIDLEQSNDNSNWSSTAIDSGLTSGTTLIEMNPTLSGYMRLKFTETDGAAAATVTAILAYQ